MGKLGDEGSWKLRSSTCRAIRSMCIITVGGDAGTNGLK
jgi:hypothetical protein